MGRLFLTIDDTLERDFRRLAVDVYGPKLGHLQDALEEALGNWIKFKTKVRKGGSKK